MKLDKMTTLLVVDNIEACLPTWEKLAFEVVVRVPDKGTLGFVIMKGPTGELMLQTRASLAEDLPEIAKKEPSYLLYADTSSLEKAKKGLSGAKIIINERKTFYGATESWVELPGGVFLGLSQH